MRAVLPWSTLIILALVPLIDPPGLVTFKWSPKAVLLLTASSVGAFFVNWSGFLVMGSCSALTHTILGQLKACVAILGGWLLFAQSYPPKALMGAAVAIASMILYTCRNLHEGSSKVRMSEDEEEGEVGGGGDDVQRQLMKSGPG